MATVLTETELDAIFKEVYADNLKDLRYKGYLLQNDIRWRPASKANGGLYHQPVLTQHEHGFTYSPSGKGAFSLNDPVAALTDDATIQGTQMLLRSRLDYEMAGRAANGAAAFVDATELLVSEMVSSRMRRTEIEMFYGQVGIGTVSSIDAANNHIVIAAAEWAPGIWAGAEGAKVQFWTGTTERLGGATAGDGATITRVDMDVREVYFDETQFDLDDAGGAVAANDEIYFHGSRASTGETGYSEGDQKGFLGLHGILTANNTPTTALFGIQPDSSSLWQPSIHSASASLTFAIVQKAIVKAVGKGLDQDLCLYIAPTVWADLLDNEVAMRRYNDKRGGQYEVGGDGIKFHSQNGTIVIKASNFVKQGYGYMIAPTQYMRIGATDWTFNLPGTAERGHERFFIHLQEQAGYELRTYTHQALFTATPGQGVLIDSITVT